MQTPSFGRISTRESQLRPGDESLEDLQKWEGEENKSALRPGVCVSRESAATRAKLILQLLAVQGDNWDVTDDAFMCCQVVVPCWVGS